MSMHSFWVDPQVEALFDAQELDELLQGTCAGDRLLAELPDTEVGPNWDWLNCFGSETKDGWVQ